MTAQFARPTIAALRRKLHSKLNLSLALLAITAGTALAEAPARRSFPIKGGSQPFATTMGADGNYWFTLSNSNRVARITPGGKRGCWRRPASARSAWR